MADWGLSTGKMETGRGLEAPSQEIRYNWEGFGQSVLQHGQPVLIRRIGSSGA